MNKNHCGIPSIIRFSKLAIYHATIVFIMS